MNVVFKMSTNLVYFQNHAVAKGKIFVSQKKPRANPMAPTIIPTLAISLVWTSPVLEAMALGGVEIGNSMAIDAQTAINEIIA